VRFARSTSCALSRCRNTAGFAPRQPCARRDARIGLVLLTRLRRARDGSPACQYAARKIRHRHRPVSGCLYLTVASSLAGTVRNTSARRKWFDHPTLLKPERLGAGRPVSPRPRCQLALACTITARLSTPWPWLDERYRWPIEDRDWCLRTWQAGFRVLYFPAASLYHHDRSRADRPRRARGCPRSIVLGEFGDFFDALTCALPKGSGASSYDHRGKGYRRLAPRKSFEAPHRCSTRATEVSLYTLGECARLVLSCECGAQLRVLRRTRAGDSRHWSDQVATWLNTASPGVACERSARIPVYLRAGHRASYYPYDQRTRHAVSTPIRQEFPLHDGSPRGTRALALAGSRPELISAGHRPADLPPACRGQPALRTGCWRSGSQPAEEPATTVEAWRSLSRRPTQPPPPPGAVSVRHDRKLVNRPALRPSISEATSSSTSVQRATVSSIPVHHDARACRRWRRWPPGRRSSRTDAHSNRDFCVDARTV